MNKNNHNIRNKKSTFTINFKKNFKNINQHYKYHRKYNTNTDNIIQKEKPKKINLQLFSFKILEAKHNSTPDLYLKKNLNNLILNRKCHLLAVINEIAIDTNFLKEFIKRFYTYEESKDRIPKYVSYYKNYLLFFCRPVFSDLTCNRKMVKHMEKVAQIFYNENYIDDDENKEIIDLNEKNSLSQKNENTPQNLEIFSQNVQQDIENYDKFSNIQKIINENNKSEILDGEDYLLLLENGYKITPININSEKNGKIKKNKIPKNNSNNSSIDLLVKELKSKKKENKNKKSKYNNFNNNSNVNNKNNINNNSEMIIDYFNNISKIIFNKKHKNNSIKNIKKISHKSIKYSSSIKKKDNYCKIINDQINNIKTNPHSKIINNINININQLTIGQKTININKNNNFIRKTNTRKKYQKLNNNNNKDNNYLLNKNIFIGYLTNKNKNISLGLPSPNAFLNKYNYLNKCSCLNIHKKKSISNYNSHNLSMNNNHHNHNNTRNKSVLKIGDSNKGYSASLHNYKKIIQKNIYTNNNGSHLSSMYNLLNNNRTTKKNIKINNYNYSVFKKNFSMCSLFSPLINKQKIFYNSKKKKYCHLSTNIIKIQNNKKICFKKYTVDENSVIKDAYRSSSFNDKTFLKNNKNDSSYFKNHILGRKKINYKKLFRINKWINNVSKKKINKSLGMKFSGKKEFMRKNKSYSKYNK